MNKSWTKVGLGACALTAIAGVAAAQKPSSAERGLIGVNLYDTGAKVVALYGSPDDIQAVTIGGTNNGGAGGSGGAPGFGGPGFGGAGGGRQGGGGRGGGASSTSADWAAPNGAPFGFGDRLFQKGGMTPSGMGPGGGGPSGPPSGAGGPGFPGGPPPGAGGGAPSGGNTQTEATKYTRWVYNRGGSKYGFIVDSQGHVVQIEAIGLQNNRVKTRKGIGFGSTFAQIIKTYGNPDGYEVGGDSLLVKYLVNKKVAFRLTRLEAKKPYVVTGIVVSAGKV